MMHMCYMLTYACVRISSAFLYDWHGDVTVQVPLVKQETAEKGSQPILAMKDFRTGKHLGFDKFGQYAETPIYRGGAVNSTTFFGWDAVPVQLGSVISVGDAVTVN